MIPKECKRLAEVDFPIAVVSNHSGRDKYIRYKPTTSLHTWWAQRPLSACRSMLLALLLPDPCDDYCPEDFKVIAGQLLSQVQGTGASINDKELRKALLKFIGDFANWDLSSNPMYLEVSRGLVNAAHPEETPLLVDPFAGAGSIPLEALRVGCEAFASDLNPVACLILRLVLDEIPRQGPDLEKRVKKAGEEVKREAEQELARFYPKEPGGARPIVYLWARAVKCESPKCGAEIPLIRSFWLCKKSKRRRAMRPRSIKSKSGIPRVEIEIFEPNDDSEVPTPVVSGAKAKCLCCGIVLPPERVRAQLTEQRGGADVVFDSEGRRVGGARLLAVVTVQSDHRIRHYRQAKARDYKAVFEAVKRLEKVSSTPLPNGLSRIPDEALPPIGTLGFRVQRYGMLQWSDLFTARQKLAITEISEAIRSHDEGKQQFPVKELLAFVLNKFVRHCNGNARWNNVVESAEPAFGSQTLPITWTFPESVPWGPWAENYDGSLNLVLKCLSKGFGGLEYAAQVELSDAVESPLPDETSDVWFTDPPYYDAIPYADLSDFFFVWLKRTLPEHSLLRDPFDLQNPLTPKIREIVQDEAKEVNGQTKDRSFFEQNMAMAFAQGRRVLKDEGIGCVVFAHKTTDGWEALLSGLIRGGWVVTGSWPIATERAGRLRARESAALEASIHLVCRPRPDDAQIGDWGDVLRQLPGRVRHWIERLQSEGIRGADLVFACIGPALEIYSRYSKVVDAQDREVPLGGDPLATEPHRRGYLTYVWEAVGRAALEQVLGTDESEARASVAGALEEDARLTALFLWTLQSTNGDGANNGEAAEAEEGEIPARSRRTTFSLIFDVVRRFAQPLGIHLPDWEGRTIEIKKGIVRLLPVTERAKQLFGKEGAEDVADRLEQSPTGDIQLNLFPDVELHPTPAIRGRGRARRRGSIGDLSGDDLEARRGATTLDRVHAAMLLQASGHTNALRSLLKAEVESSPDFLRLANALSALYPKGCEEKRLLDAMLLAVPK